MKTITISPEAIIYGLRAEGSEDLRYVGRTTKELAHRLQRHFWQARAQGSTCSRPISVWIREMGFAIEIYAIETVPASQAAAREYSYMQEALAAGASLLNRLGNDWSPSARQRELIVAANRRRFEDPEARARIGRISRERVYTDEQREAISLRMRGHRHTDETKAKMSAARKGVPKSPEHRANMRKAQARRWGREVVET